MSEVASEKERAPLTSTIGRLDRLVDRALAAVAAAVALSLVFAGWRDVSQAFDVWY